VVSRSVELEELWEFREELVDVVLFEVIVYPAEDKARTSRIRETAEEHDTA